MWEVGAYWAFLRLPEATQDGSEARYENEHGSLGRETRADDIIKDFADIVELPRCKDDRAIAQKSRRDAKEPQIINEPSTESQPEYRKLTEEID